MYDEYKSTLNTYCSRECEAKGPIPDFVDAPNHSDDTDDDQTVRVSTKRFKRNQDVMVSLGDGCPLRPAKVASSCCDGDARVGVVFMDASVRNSKSTLVPANRVKCLSEYRHKDEEQSEQSEVMQRLSAENEQLRAENKRLKRKLAEIGDIARV